MSKETMENREKLFKGAYASTLITPTEREIEYVMGHFDEIVSSQNRDPYQTRTFTADQHGLECSCLSKNRNKETDVTAYGFQLDELMTDIPKEDWDDSCSRNLSLLICEDCKEWALCD